MSIYIRLTTRRILAFFVRLTPSGRKRLEEKADVFIPANDDLPPEQRCRFE